MKFAIQRDGESVASGGFSGNLPAPPPKLPPTFTNFTSAGDPINVANGNMYRDETDIVYPNLGVPLTFSRHYDSLSKDDFGMGVGWMYTFGDVIYTEVDQGQTNRVWLDSSGRRHVFKPNGSGGYIVPADLQGELTYTPGAGEGVVNFVFKSRDGVEYRFEKRTLTQTGRPVVGRLASVMDRNGDGVVVEYQATTNRKIAQIRDIHSTEATPLRRLSFGYTSDQITRVTTFYGARPLASGTTPTRM